LVALRLIDFGCLWMVHRLPTRRVVGVFVRFRAPLQQAAIISRTQRREKSLLIILLLVISFYYLY
jgi:hypothetical protein